MSPNNLPLTPQSQYASFAANITIDCSATTGAAGLAGIFWGLNSWSEPAE
jgi:hypothetical protein